MAYGRRRFHTRTLVRAPKRRTTWARVTNNDATPAASTTNAYDLLAAFNTASGISLSLPNITIGRVILKIVITITVSPSYSANTGALISLSVADRSDISGGSGTINNPVSSPYDQNFMWWEELYLGEQVQASGVTTNATLYKSLDIRSMRRLTNGGETLVLSAVATGNCTITGISFTGQTLLKLP